MNKKDLFLEFEHLTQQILDLDVDDEEIVKKIELIIDKRDRVITKINESEGQVSDDLLEKIFQLNNQGETKLEEIMLGIKSQIKRVKQEKSLSSTKRKANRGYMNIGHQNDGYFIDKKK